ncbi:hypothetical protein MM239_19330 [Belliella sp. DSM 111904]|uniref:DUF4476 domain-containing protein n=1 Tax=Belliella filtrata TaxID=2923435 RepID=A0ABS9V6H9_9BACT|nr:hypothetical protein [Belliella filtrata]MCH7411548.1 hypothetical protein [Belliella filtrata]
MKTLRNLTVLFCLLLVTKPVLSQNQEDKKLIGKVNLGGNAKYILQYSVQEEHHIYEIIKAVPPGSNLESFRLIFNDFDTFDKNLKILLDDISKTEDSFSDVLKDARNTDESMKYFYALQTMRPAVEEATKGPIAMTMKFGKEAQIRKTPSGTNDYLTKNDFLKFLRNTDIVKQDYLDNFMKNSFGTNKESLTQYINFYTFENIQNRVKNNLESYLPKKEVEDILSQDDSVVHTNYLSSIRNDFEREIKLIVKSNSTRDSSLNCV